MHSHALIVAAIFGLSILGFCTLPYLAGRPRKDEPQQCEHEDEREPEPVPLAA